ncbi:MAG: helix-turn-helix transcriptional regulator, partial [Alphaproteobacteria bacterium]|nr:helix-turn-helix transcriptional regulator [Alphaproteobacteria bacterium]
MPGPISVDVHVGKRLRFGRTMKGMSQEAIGDSIGVTFQQIQKYERGVNCIRAGKLFELAKVLKVPVSFFFEGFEGGGVEGEGRYTIPGAADSGSDSFD